MKSFIHTYQIDDVNICDELINYHNNNIEYKLPGKIKNGKIDTNVKDSIDVSFYPQINNPIIKKYFKYLQNGLNNFIEHYKWFNFKCNVNSDVNIQYYPKGAGFKAWHYERGNYDFNELSRALVFMTYLNDVKDGGETEWFYQKIKIKPKKGLTVFWPTDWTHTHRGIPSLTEEKYIVTGWLHFIP